LNEKASHEGTSKILFWKAIAEGKRKPARGCLKGERQARSRERPILGWIGPDLQAKGEGQARQARAQRSEPTDRSRIEGLVAGRLSTTWRNPSGAGDGEDAAVVHGKLMALSGGEKHCFERGGRMPKLGFLVKQGCAAWKSV